jgi:hypothetical protein
MTKSPELVSSDMIACTKSQKKWLMEHGKFGETYADILKRLIECWEEVHDEGDDEATEQAKHVMKAIKKH